MSGNSKMLPQNANPDAESSRSQKSDPVLNKSCDNVEGADETSESNQAAVEDNAAQQTITTGDENANEKPAEATSNNNQGSDTSVIPEGQTNLPISEPGTHDLAPAGERATCNSSAPPESDNQPENTQKLEKDSLSGSKNAEKGQDTEKISETAKSVSKQRADDKAAKKNETSKNSPLRKLKTKSILKPGRKSSDSSSKGRKDDDDGNDKSGSRGLSHAFRY